MSKNKQMHSEMTEIVGADRATAGPASIAQGVYGARGNLELLACDAVDGLWVFWFNADHDDDPLQTPEVPPGRWSAGLHFAAGARYVDAQIVQSPLGPNHLEVLALDAEGVLQSWYWSPEAAFTRRGTDAASDVARFRLGEPDDEGALRATTLGGDGRIRGFASAPLPYPERSWHPASAGPALDDERAVHRLGELGVLHRVVPGTALSADSTRHGGTVELVWREHDGLLRHRDVPA